MQEYIEGLVSIVMPSYNTGKYICETIESVLQQTYTDWELIIVDDCSKDNTLDILAQYEDKRIRVLVNEKNSGAAVSRNRAIAEAKGEWIAFLDSDDLWVRDKLEKQILFMKENGYSFTCAYNTYIDENSKELNKLDTCPSKITRFGMLTYNWVGCLTAMYHYPDVGLVQIEDIPKRNDYAMWLQITKKVDCYCLPEVLGHYRVRKQSVSHTSVKKLIKAHYDMFRKCEKFGILKSTFFTGINMIMAVYRRKRFVKKIGNKT